MQITSFLDHITRRLWLHPHHNVFQLHVQHVCSNDVLLPVVWFLICIHVVQDQLKEDELLGDGTERVVEAEHVVSILSFNTGRKPQGSESSCMRLCQYSTTPTSPV